MTFSSRYSTVLAAVVLVLAISVAPVGAGTKPGTVRITINVKQNQLTVIEAKARLAAFKVCAKKSSVQKVKVTARRAGVGYGYDYRCTELTGAASTTTSGATTGTTATKPSISGDATVGSTLETRNGTFKLHAYEQPWVDPSRYPSQPSAGKEFATVDVEGCSTAPNLVQLNPYQFTLVMPDNSRLEPSGGYRDPALNATPLATGDCARGWMTFEVPVGVRPKELLVQADSAVSPGLFRWTIPAG